MEGSPDLSRPGLLPETSQLTKTWGITPSNKTNNKLLISWNSFFLTHLIIMLPALFLTVGSGCQAMELEVECCHFQIIQKASEDHITKPQTRWQAFQWIVTPMTITTLWRQIRSMAEGRFTHRMQCHLPIRGTIAHQTTSSLLNLVRICRLARISRAWQIRL